MTLLLKAFVGAAVVVLIGILSKSKNFYLAGLVPLFPIFALIAHYTIGTNRHASDLKATALFGIASMIPYSLYLLSVYFFSERCRLQYTLFFSLMIWAIAASLLVKVWNSRF